jgi:hypothetical protein
VDLDNVAGGGVGGGVVAPWQQNAVAKLTRRLYRNSFRRALTAISAAAVSNNFVWNAQPVNPGIIPVNPDTDVAQDLIAATNITGIRPNRVAYGDTAALYRQQAYGAQNNPAGYLGYGSDPEAAIASALQVDKVKISRSHRVRRYYDITTGYAKFATGRTRHANPSVPVACRVFKYY